MESFAATPSVPAILTVSQISRSIRNLLEGEFRFVRVSGEISNLSRPYSGHSYFTLKDEGAQLRAVLFKGQQRFLAKDIGDGQQVICHGRISVYEPRGDYQLIIDTIDFQGAGLLQLQFEELKKRLAAEGLFDQRRKKMIPLFPRKITLITSPTGAAVHDFLKIWRKRGWGAVIQIFPVRVQGTDAAAEIAGAIASINKKSNSDIIVLCRGGGSLEDLWAFNEECVARAIADSALPIVSAIGHEVDFTIADFCADLRAPTPTGAAEQIIPDLATLQRQIGSFKRQLTTLLLQKIDGYSRQVSQNKRLLGDLGLTLSHFTLQIDHTTSRLTHSMERLLQQQTLSLERVISRLERQSPVTRMTIQTQRLRHATAKLIQQTRVLLQQKSAAFSAQAALLDSVSPLATLARGYAIVSRKNSEKREGEIITRSSQVHPGEQLDILLHSGRLECGINRVIEP
ncbi:MAG: exodeoxyribonuclease VII large subunit [Desulfoarculaceae bacterium]|nr:exodeoxyribonuclease VII large subunit [Desulfoarculaceae bacterium]